MADTQFPWRCESGNCRSTSRSDHESIYDPETVPADEATVNPSDDPATA